LSVGVVPLVDLGLLVRVVGCHVEHSRRPGRTGVVYSHDFNLYFFVSWELFRNEEPDDFVGSHLFRAGPFPAGAT